MWGCSNFSIAEIRHSLITKAYDAANNIGVSQIVTVSVDNTPPTVNITGPIVASAARRSTLTIRASASDSIMSITKVEFYVNNALMCVDSTSPSPYSCVWKVPNAHKKKYSIVAKAYDKAGNSATSMPIIITSN